jgi:hypothetical protein
MKWEVPINAGDFQSVVDDTYPARCIRIIDLGTQVKTFEGKEIIKREVLFVWELPTELLQDGERAGMPYTVSKFYRQSLHEKSSLRHDLMTWLQDKYGAWEATGDPKLLLGLACLVTVAGGRVQAVIKPTKGMTVPKVVHPTVYFSLDDGEFDRSIYESLTDGVKNIIANSPEFDKATHPNGHKHDDAGYPVDPMGDDIPF